MKIKDYRPISLVTSLYKIIAKVLSLRVREVLGETIGLAQGAFVKGRQILDLALIANEGVEEYRELKKEGVVFKIDFEKAYDHVEWDFLDHVMEMKGFGEKWKSWIRGCLSSTNFSIMINGRPRGNFKASRGLRQGDPLSPFLFVLVADVLDRLVVKAREAGIVEGFKIGRDKVELSHLQFADDTIFFLSKSEENLKNVMSLLEIFGVASGLNLNKNKSSIVGINIEDEEMTTLASLIGCETGSWPLSYLGLPLGDNPRRVGFWSPVVEKVSRRLEGWYKGCLSKGGRLTLIQSVLESIPIYYLSLFKIPVSVANHIEKLMRDFLWESYEGEKGDHLVNWKVVTKSKKKGGLGIGNILKRNEAFLGKWLWRFPLEQGSLWCSIIRSKYGSHCNGWDSNTVLRGSHRNPWKAISIGISQFSQLIRINIGNGRKTRFWEDPWLEVGLLASSFPRLYRVSCNVNENAGNLVEWLRDSSIGWNLSFRRNFNDGELEEYLELLNKIDNVVLQRNSEDNRKWMGNKEGIFSCNSYFEYLTSNQNDSFFAPFKLIWKTGVPPKVKVLAWLASWRRINTCDFLQIRKPFISISPSRCFMCKADSESVDHLFIHCNFAHSIWNSLIVEFSVTSAFPKTWYDLVALDWSFSGNKKKSRSLWRYGCLALMWCLWNERNRRVFEDKEMRADEVWDKIKLMASTWAFASRLFGNLSISDINRDWRAAMS